MWYVIISSPKYAHYISGVRRIWAEDIAYGPFENQEDARRWNDNRGRVGALITQNPGSNRVIHVTSF